MRTGRLNVQRRTSIDWIVDVPAADLKATEWWVFRFVELNPNTTLEGLYIASSGSGIREQNVPPTASRETDGSSSSEPATSPTQYTPSTSFTGGVAATTAEGTVEGTGGLTTGAKAGVGIGAVAGALILIGAGWFLGKKRTQKPSHEADQPLMTDNHNQSWNNAQFLCSPATSPGEVRYAELETSQPQGSSGLGSDR